MKKIIALVTSLLFSVGAYAVCNPFTANTVLTASALNGALSAGCITSGTIDGVIIGSAVPVTLTASSVSASSVSASTLSSTSDYSLNGKKTLSATAPTIASGFGTGATIPVSNGTAAFQINVGTGGTASSGVLTVPAMTTGLACSVSPTAAPQAGAVTYAVPTSTTSVTVTNYTLSTGAALAWPASTVLQLVCHGE